MLRPVGLPRLTAGRPPRFWTVSPFTPFNPIVYGGTLAASALALAVIASPPLRGRRTRPGTVDLGIAAIRTVIGPSSVGAPLRRSSPDLCGGIEIPARPALWISLYRQIYLPRGLLDSGRRLHPFLPICWRIRRLVPCKHICSSAHSCFRFSFSIKERPMQKHWSSGRCSLIEGSRRHSP